MGDFQKDLAVGSKAQDFIISQLKEEHEGLVQVEGNFKDFDLKAPDGYTVEVKFDILSQKTENVGFEYKCYGKKSGVSNTKALDWVHIYYLDGKWVYSKVSTNNLKAFLKSNWDSLKKVSGGDNNASKMALVSVYDIADSFGYTSITST